MILKYKDELTTYLKIGNAEILVPAKYYDIIKTNINYSYYLMKKHSESNNDSIINFSNINFPILGLKDKSVYRLNIITHSNYIECILYKDNTEYGYDKILYKGE